ncbi:hypothetical protein D3C72_1927670 [compost metagenome]
MVQLPSAARLSGNSKPAAAARSCTASSTQPASTVRVRFFSSRSRTRFMRLRLSKTWRPDWSGTAPPTSPVLPPCGTIATRAAEHAATTAQTWSVLPGNATARARPR